MSDVSMLSHEYQTASELSELINRALLVLKKERLGLMEWQSTDAASFVRDRNQLISVLETIRALLDNPASTAIAAGHATRIPGTLVARIREERRGDLPYYLEDVEQAAERLRHNISTTDRDLTLLDELAAAADAETSGVFRQLMRK